MSAFEKPLNLERHGTSNDDLCCVFIVFIHPQPESPYVYGGIREPLSLLASIAKRSATSQEFGDWLEDYHFSTQHRQNDKEPPIIREPYQTRGHVCVFKKSSLTSFSPPPRTRSKLVLHPFVGSCICPWKVTYPLPPSSAVAARSTVSTTSCR